MKIKFEKIVQTKDKSGIEFFKLTNDDLKEYKKIARKGSIFNIFGFISGLVLCCVGFIEYNPWKFVDTWNIATMICYVIIGIAFIITALYCLMLLLLGIELLFKQIGIRYGRISRKYINGNSRNTYRSYNVYFEDIHRSLKRVTAIYDDRLELKENVCKKLAEK